MKNKNNFKYSSKIKTEPEQYDYQKEMPIKEENNNNSNSTNSNRAQNYNNAKNNTMKNNYKNKQYNPQKNQGNNKFLGIKREKQDYDRDNSSNQNNINKNNNNNSKNIKQEKEDNFSNPLNNGNNNGNMFNHRNNNNFNKFQNNKNYKNKNSSKITFKDLPILKMYNNIISEMNSSRFIIISGNTGCGKSTQVPQYIYGMNCQYKILMTQPRRIAAVSIAKRLAQEMGEKVGGKIGYHVSMNPKISSDTKIFVKTTGIFMEELIHRSLDYTHIIIDEVHERDIYVDLVLALIKYYFEQNPTSNIKVILMSATIAEEDFALYLNDCNKGNKVPIIKVLESRHNVQEFGLEEIIYKLGADNYISEELKKEIHNVSQLCIDQLKPVPVFKEELFPVVAGLIEKIENENPSNFSGVLIFVPGLAEIQELQNYLSRYFLNKTTLEFLILHSQISDDEQDMVFADYQGKRKIILATNIAESSITISNIDFVIDFCLVKQTRFDEYQNTSILELKWCSKASVQQRKGRTGRTNKGFYFQLITKKLYNKLTNHPIAEILRTPLETPILKLKIYEPEKEPGDILLKTIQPPQEDKIINTLFRLEKMGALIQGNYAMKKVEEEPVVDPQTGWVKKVVKDKKIYKSGIITKVGRIFAELPIDIKYSRLIMIAFALGEIDLGITLAAIISQDKSMFLSSDKCNRYNIYNSKNYFCFKKSCDFIACYTAYKKWYFKWGHKFVKSNVKFDTQLQHVGGALYEQIRKDTFSQALDLRVLKEIIKVENDLKKRLSKFRLYSEHLSSFKNPTETINFQKEEDAFLLKVILAGTFYNQIFSPDYDDTRNIEEEILVSRDAPDQEKESELKTIRISNIIEEDARKLIQIFDALVKPDNIIQDDYDKDCCIYKIQFDTEEAVKKILFITSSASRRGKEIPIFEYIKNEKITTNEANSLGAKNDNSVIIKLIKEPEYYYRVHYFDEYNRENVFPDKDSINLIQIIPNLEQLKLCKLVTDSYNNKSGNTLKKFARYTSVFPPEQNFDKLIMLIFAPQYKMVGYKEGGDENIDKDEKYLKYIGFQSYELTGLKGFEDNDYNNTDFRYDRSKFIKLDYLITNYHLQIINEIRVLINEMIKFKFISKIPESMFFIEEDNNENFISDMKFKDDSEEKELKKEEFDELFLEYKKKAKKIYEKIRMIITEKKIRNISDKKYQELFDYIEKERNNKKNQNNINKNINKNTIIFENLSDSDMDEDDNENEAKEEKAKETQKTNIPSYFGYINQISELQKKVQEDDFLQLHEPLQITGESIFDNETREELNSREKRIKNLYNDVVMDLRTKESLAFNSDAWLVCSICCKEICPIREGNPVLTNEKVGEYRIFGPWLKENLKLIFNKNKNKKKKKPLYDEDEKNKFIEELKKENIEFDNLYTCPSHKHIIGYVRKDERFIYYDSNLTIKYPDLTYEKIIGHDYFLNNFKDVHKKVEEIMNMKKTDDFKRKIFCKLCGFEVKEDLDEFKEHLDSDIHKDKMKELRKEFI